MAGRCRLRPIVRTDLDALVALEGVAFDDPWSRSQLADAIGWRESVALLAESEDGVAGYIMGRVVVDQGEILSLAVAPDRRRQGLGRELLDHALAAMLERGATAAWLEVRESNAAARGLYRRAGFAESARRRDYYRQPVEDALVLMRELAQSGPSLRHPDASATR